MITHVSKCWIYSRNNLELIAQEEYCLIFPHWLTILKFTVYHTTSHSFSYVYYFWVFFFCKANLLLCWKWWTFDKQPAFSKSPLQLSARSINLLNLACALNQSTRPFIHQWFHSSVGPSNHLSIKMIQDVCLYISLTSVSLPSSPPSPLSLYQTRDWYFYISRVTHVV